MGLPGISSFPSINVCENGLSSRRLRKIIKTIKNFLISSNYTLSTAKNFTRNASSDGRNKEEISTHHQIVGLITQVWGNSMFRPADDCVGKEKILEPPSFGGVIFKLIRIFKELAPIGTKIQKFKLAIQLSLGKLSEKTIR